jgi:23S rRNA pseudouridine1911/1915/1917 synthase
MVRYTPLVSRLLYLDSDLLILDKAHGEAVQGRRPDQKLLIDYWRSFLRDDGLQPIHRIDQPVGGVVVLARSPEAYAEVQRALQSSSIHRLYIAVLDGRPEPEAGVLENRLAVDRNGNRSVEDEHGKYARLSYRTIGVTRHHTVVAVTLDTGRHHQIRAQFAARGVHVVGDAKYGARRALKDKSIALNAHMISLPHPTQPLRLSIRSRFPRTSLWRSVSELVFQTNFQGVDDRMH